MTYYDTINSEADFAKKFQRTGAKSWDSLDKSDALHGGASHWSAAHLFASRVVCAKPQRRLALFTDGGFLPASGTGVHTCINRLIQGSTAGFRDNNEPRIVQQHQPDSLGYVWAALGRVLQAEPAGIAPDRPTRARQPPPEHGIYSSSTSMRVGSSSPASSTKESVGESAPSESSKASLYFEKPSSDPLEDLTVRLASCFIRCVINYAQPIDTTYTYPINFRDERVMHRFEYAPDKWIRAIDDGGLQAYDGQSFLQVALLEAKRSFQKFTLQGMPTVADETLGQLVGEALAFRSATKTEDINEDNCIIILAVTQYVKFFHFHITRHFLDELKRASPATDYLRVYSTEWFDLNMRDDRKEVVKHLLAILSWAGEQRRGRGEDESMDSVDDGGDDGDEFMED